MLPRMVSRLPLGAGTLLDVKRAARVIDAGAWTPDSKGWRMPLRRAPARSCPVPGTTLRERWPWPETSPWRRRQSLPSASPDKLVTRRALTTKSAHDARACGG